MRLDMLPGGVWRVPASHRLSGLGQAECATGHVCHWNTSLHRPLISATAHLQELNRLLSTESGREQLASMLLALAQVRK